MIRLHAASLTLFLGVASLCLAHAPTAAAQAGDLERGRLLLRQFGCGECHRIPGVAAAQGSVGPPLDAVGGRAYLAGRLPNTPDNMVRWIRAPKSVDPGTTMPDLSVGEGHARDMTAYLYSLR